MGNLKEHEITLQEVIYKPKSSTGGSTKLNQENEEKKMTSPFLYFVSFIDSPAQQLPNLHPPTPFTTNVIPYIPGISEKIRRIIDMMFKLHTEQKID
ncbi:uncharacterized protein isoform X2 [Leptinotarsa decemlineata]|uniref:uncharacterized protein isoform X2 n=1 Tax=Leptinotarsa decemlineata TaxID=7539 RepID=UPI003D30A9DF